MRHEQVLRRADDGGLLADIARSPAGSMRIVNGYF
jgi:hypothetical protein